MRGLLEQRFHNVPETSNLADFPNDVEKGNCECVRLVMLVLLLAYFILLIYMRTSDI